MSPKTNTQNNKNNEEIRTQGIGFFKRNKDQIIVGVIVAFVMMIIAFIFILFFTTQNYSLRALGIGSSTFEHPDFKEAFLQRFQTGKTYSYTEINFLKVTIVNRFSKNINVKTILRLPKFMTYSCTLNNPDIEESCENYWIKGDDRRYLYFNITVGDNPKAEGKIFLYTRQIKDRLFGLSTNDLETPLKVLVLPPEENKN